MGVFCPECGLAVKRNSGSLSCGTCSEAYHASCASVTEADLKVLEELHKSWTCESCLSKVRLDRRDNTPIRPLPEPAADSVSPILKELLAGMKRIQDDQQDLKTSFASFQASITDHTATMEKLTEAISAVRDQMDGLKSENESLRKRVSALEVHLQRAEQVLVKNVIEIHGVPFNEGECVDALVCV